MDRARALEDSLRRLSLIVDGIQTSALVNDDGLTIAAYPNTADAALLAATAANLNSLAHRSLERLSKGTPRRLLLEGDAGTLLSCRAGSATLALLIDPDASLAHILFATQKTAADIEAILAPA